MLAVYKTLRSLEGMDGCEIDETISMCSEVTMCEAFIEPVQSKILNLLLVLVKSHLFSKKNLYFTIIWMQLEIVRVDLFNSYLIHSLGGFTQLIGKSIN